MFDRSSVYTLTPDCADLIAEWSSDPRFGEPAIASFINSWNALPTAPDLRSRKRLPGTLLERRENLGALLAHPLSLSLAADALVELWAFYENHPSDLPAPPAGVSGRLEPPATLTDCLHHLASPKADVASMIVVLADVFNRAQSKAASSPVPGIRKHFVDADDHPLHRPIVVPQSIMDDATSLLEASPVRTGRFGWSQAPTSLQPRTRWHRFCSRRSECGRSRRSRSGTHSLPRLRRLTD